MLSKDRADHSWSFAMRTSGGRWVFSLSVMGARKNRGEVRAKPWQQEPVAEEGSNSTADLQESCGDSHLM
jgi:hypothetical protein